jgi:NAD(P) transhydrogenase subunit alpha
MMMDAMRSGSVIIDIAAATGGNTPFTKNDDVVVRNGVTIVGNSNLQATMPSDASKLYGKNILNFLQLITNKDGALDVDWNDDLVKGCCVTHEGKVVMNA